MTDEPDEIDDDFDDQLPELPDDIEPDEAPTSDIPEAPELPAQAPSEDDWEPELPDVTPNTPEAPEAVSEPQAERGVDMASSEEPLTESVPLPPLDEPSDYVVGKNPMEELPFSRTTIEEAGVIEADDLLQPIVPLPPIPHPDAPQEPPKPGSVPMQDLGVPLGPVEPPIDYSQQGEPGKDGIQFRPEPGTPPPPQTARQVPLDQLSLPPQMEDSQPLQVGDTGSTSRPSPVPPLPGGDGQPGGGDSNAAMGQMVEQLTQAVELLRAMDARLEAIADKDGGAVFQGGG